MHILVCPSLQIVPEFQHAIERIILSGLRRFIQQSSEAGIVRMRSKVTIQAGCQHKQTEITDVWRVCKLAIAPIGHRLEGFLANALPGNPWGACLDCLNEIRERAVSGSPNFFRSEEHTS